MIENEVLVPGSRLAFCAVRFRGCLVGLLVRNEVQGRAEREAASKLAFDAEGHALTAGERREQRRPLVAVLAAQDLGQRAGTAPRHGIRRVDHELGLDLEVRDHLDAPQAEQDRQRPTGHVVGRSARRIALDLEQVLRVLPIGLVALHDQRPRRIAAAVGLEVRRRGVHLDAAAIQDVHQASQATLVGVIHRQEPGARRGRLAGSTRGLHGALGGRDGVVHIGLAITNEAAEQRLAEAQLVTDDVGQAPPATGPWIGELVRRLIARQVAGGAQLARRQEDRRGDVHRRGLGQEPDDVVAHGHVAVAAVPPHVVGHAGRDAGEPAPRHVEQRARADRVDARDHTRVQVRVERIAERRHEQALAVAALLVHVPVHGRAPDLVDLLGHEARLLEREPEPVAVVVVARVVLVQAQQPGTFVGRAQLLAVPVHDLVEPIGVDRRHDHNDQLLARRAIGLLLGRRQLPRELHPELGAGRLGRVHRARDEQHRRRAGDQLGALFAREPARVGNPSRLFADLVEARHVGLAADRRHQEVAPTGRLADLGDVDTRALREAAVPGRDLVPVGQLEVGPHRTPEEGFGRHRTSPLRVG